jgi:hypothetical protein
VVGADADKPHYVGHLDINGSIVPGHIDRAAANPRAMEGTVVEEYMRAFEFKNFEPILASFTKRLW